MVNASPATVRNSISSNRGAVAAGVGSGWEKRVRHVAVRQIKPRVQRSGGDEGGGNVAALKRELGLLAREPGAGQVATSIFWEYNDNRNLTLKRQVFHKSL